MTKNHDNVVKLVKWEMVITGKKEDDLGNRNLRAQGTSFFVK